MAEVCGCSEEGRLVIPLCVLDTILQLLFACGYHVHQGTGETIHAAQMVAVHAVVAEILSGTSQMSCRQSMHPLVVMQT